jgi:hypothetical protein
MNVSNFTIASRPDGHINRETRYMLQITNLDETAIEFSINCHIAANDGGTIWISSFNKGMELSAYLNEVVNMNIPFSIFKNKGNDFVSSALIKIEPHHCFNFTLSKKALHIKDESREEYLHDDIALQGFVELSIPMASRLSASYFNRPQTNHDVKVLLNARRDDSWNDSYKQPLHTNGLVSPWKFPVSGLYSSESITLSTGKAENTITPDGAFTLKDTALKDFQSRWQARELSAADIAGASDIDEKEKPAKLIDLLLSINNTADNVEMVNQVLSMCNAGVRLENHSENYK